MEYPCAEHEKAYLHLAVCISPLTQPAFYMVWNRTKDEGFPVSHSAPAIQSSTDSLAHTYQTSQTKGKLKIELRILYRSPVLLYAFSICRYICTHVYTYMVY